MRKLLGFAENVLFGLNVLIIFLLVFEHQLVLPSWLQVFGRMHPMFLHFPIVILLLASGIYFYQSFNKRIVEDEFVRVLVLLGALSTSLTVIMGLFLSREGGYTGTIVYWHKWLGVGVSILAALWYFYGFVQKKVFLGRITVGLVAVCLVVGGHLGAELTHGENFLFAPVRLVKANQMVSLDEAMVYDHFVKAIMDEKCVSCHNPDKAKGKLILTSSETMMKGGKDGKLFEPGNPDESLVMKRFHLPLEDKKHMPPKNKPQLTESELDIIEYWIKSGGDFSKRVIDLAPDDTLRRLLEQRMLSSSPLKEEVYTFAPADEGTIKKLNTAYRVVEPLSINSPALSVNIYNAAEYKSSLLSDLSIIQTQIVNLDLNKLPVSDEDLKTIGKFENLRRLNLNFTDITGVTLASLQTLKHLEYLSMSSTKVKPEHLHDLASLENLKRIYLWNTSLTSDDIDKLRTDLHHVVVETGFVPDHSKKLHLPPPRIENDQKIYSKDFTITMTHPVKGAEIRYTLDGTEPDSVNGVVYEGPIKGTSSMTSLKAVAYKEGWWGSQSTGGTFYKTTFTPDTVILVSFPERKYLAKGAATLTDHEGGAVNFASREGWLGFRKDRMEVVAQFKKPEELKSITLCSNYDVGGFIFPAHKIQVWGGRDKNDMKLLSTIEPEQPDKYIPVMQKGLECSFEKQSIGYLRIVAEPISKLPSWHKSKGEKGWLFVDEVLFN